MAKGYYLSAHRSEADLIKKATYNLLAKDALEKAGGKVIAMAKVGEKLTVHENDVNQSTVLIELNTYDEALNAYHYVDNQEALLALDYVADRDIRIFEGIFLKAYKWYLETRKFNARIIHFSYDARLSF